MWMLWWVLTCACHKNLDSSSRIPAGKCGTFPAAWDKCTGFLDMAEGGDFAARKEQHCCSVVPNLGTRPSAFCLDCLSGKRKHAGVTPTSGPMTLGLQCSLSKPQSPSCRLVTGKWGRGSNKIDIKDTSPTITLVKFCLSNLRCWHFYFISS